MWECEEEEKSDRDNPGDLEKKDSMKIIKDALEGHSVSPVECLSNNG